MYVKIYIYTLIIIYYIYPIYMYILYAFRLYVYVMQPFQLDRPTHHRLILTISFRLNITKMGINNFLMKRTYH